MRSFRTKVDDRRATFLSLAGQVESQLREAYDKRYRKGTVTQSSLAKALDVDRSAIHRRLTGRTNMTIETIADMVWALGCAVKIVIYDPSDAAGQNAPGPLPAPSGFSQAGWSPHQPGQGSTGLTAA